MVESTAANDGLAAPYSTERNRLLTLSPDAQEADIQALCPLRAAMRLRSPSSTYMLGVQLEPHARCRATSADVATWLTLSDATATL